MGKPNMGDHRDGCKMSQVVPSFMLMFVFLSVSLSVRPRGPLKELQQLQEVLLGSKFK